MGMFWNTVSTKWKKFLNCELDTCFFLTRGFAFRIRVRAVLQAFFYSCFASVVSSVALSHIWIFKIFILPLKKCTLLQKPIVQFIVYITVYLIVFKLWRGFTKKKSFNIFNVPLLTFVSPLCAKALRPRQTDYLIIPFRRFCPFKCSYTKWLPLELTLILLSALNIARIFCSFCLQQAGYHEMERMGLQWHKVPLQ